jgi:hydroxymethylpyrimidine/phosphomethylpyrimidine kinase
LRDTLVPLAQVTTPNLPEAGVLLGSAEPASLADMQQAVRALHRPGAGWVLLKGGHLSGETSTDLLFDGTTISELSTRRIATHNTHGTGCTLSSAITALLPRFDMAVAVRRAKAYLTDAIATSAQLSVGSGHGPVHHFHAIWQKDQAP